MRSRSAAWLGGVAVALVIGGCGSGMAGQAELGSGRATASASTAGASTAAGTAGASGPAVTAATPTGPPARPLSPVSPVSPLSNGAPVSSFSAADATGPVSSSSAPRGPRSAAVPLTTTELTVRSGAATRPASPSGSSVVPGLSPVCQAVEASITAFATVFGATGSGSDTVISRATVTAALKSLPVAGLPAPVQADVTVLRRVVLGAAGQTVAQLAVSISDGKAAAALSDLASYATQYCA